MIPPLPALIGLAGRTVSQPREVATAVLSFGADRRTLWMALGLVVAVGVLLGEAVQAVMPPPPEDVEVVYIPPLLFAAVLYAFTAAFAWLLAELGRRLGGPGRFDEALALIVFLQFALLLAEVVQILLVFVAPPLAAFWFLGILVLAFWVNIQFVDVLHGYGSLLKSFGVIVAATTLMAITLLTLLTLSGVGLETR